MTIYEQLQIADKLPKSKQPLDLMEFFRLAYELKRLRELDEKTNRRKERHAITD